MSENQVNSSGPPIPKLGDSYLLFKKEVKLWSATTLIEEKRQAGCIVFMLPQKAKSEAVEVPLEVLQNGRTDTVDGAEVKKSGLDCLLEVLDGIYLEDLAKEKFKTYDMFRKLSREGSQDVKEFISSFEKVVKQMEEHDIKLPQPVLAYELLRSCNVSDYKYSVAITMCGDLTYTNMKETIKKITTMKDPESSHQRMIGVVKEDSTFYTGNSCIENQFNKYDEYESENEVLNAQEMEQHAYYSQGRSGYSGRGYRGYGFSRGNARGARGNRQQNQQQESQHQVAAGVRSDRKMNPTDRYGRHFTCNVCKSIYHFSRDCLERRKINKSGNQVTSENVNLFMNAPAQEENSNVMDQFTSDNFGLAVLDSGCNKTVCGKEWLKVYLQSLSPEDFIKVCYEEKHVSFKFGDNAPSKSRTCCTFPAVVCDKKVNIVAQIVDDQIPLLISKQSMKDARMVLDFGDDTVKAFGVKQKIILNKSGHCSIPLSKYTIHQQVCLCKSGEEIVNLTMESTDKRKTAIKLHKQFAHPPPEKLKSLLRTAGQLTKEIAREIDTVSSNCDVCKRYKRPNNRPVVCMPLAKDFNDTVAMDIKVYDKNKNIYIQHMIDHKTRFSAAKVIRSKDKETIVESVFTHWINTFGPPKKFMSDNGGEYVNKSFVDLCEKFNVHIITTGAEAPWSNALVERHHALLSNSMIKIMEDTKCSVEVALAWACHAKNTLANVNGFSPYQLIFGKNPSLISIDDPYASPTIVEDESPSETVAKNISAIYSARKRMMESEASEMIRRAIRSKTREVYTDEIQSGDMVYYKRNDDKRWRGPGTVIGVDKKVVVVRHGGYIVRCHRIHVVNVNDLYSKDVSEVSGTDPPDEPNPTVEEFYNATQMLKNDVLLNALHNAPAEEGDSNTVSTDNIPQSDETNVEESMSTKEQKFCKAKSKYEKKKVSIEVLNTDPYKSQKTDEIEKWKQNNVYEEVEAHEVDDQFVPISTRWVTNDNGHKKKARLVARGFEEIPLDSTERVSPTCRKESLRLLFTVAASMKWPIHSLDITSAFLQGKPIERLVYLTPPKECYKPGILWKLNKCVYGLSDAAKMWYRNVKDHSEQAGLKKCLYDDALFFSRVDREDLTGIMTVHVDDFIYAGTKGFESNIHKDVLHGFEIKSQEASRFTYLGLEVEQDPITYEITVGQSDYISALKTIGLSSNRRSQKTHALTHEEYVQYRSGVGQLIWLSVQTRPDISFDACQLSNNLKDPNVSDIMLHNKIVKKLKTDEDAPLTFRGLPNIKNGVRLLTYSDASFGNLSNNGSQCGYLILISDKDGRVKNPVCWKSVKLDRVCYSTLAAESLALLKAADHTIFIQQTLRQILGASLNVTIDCYIDNKGLLELVQKTKDPIEKRLIVTMASLREMVEKGEITVNFMPSRTMPADVLTKRGPSSQSLRMCFERD